MAENATPAVEAAPVETPPAAPPVETPAPARRGPGRPRKAPPPDAETSEAARAALVDADAPEEPRRGRGRPPKDVAQAAKAAAREAEAAQIKTLLGLSLKPLNSVFAVKAPEMVYTPEELDTITTLGAAVLVKHVPEILTKWGEEIALALTLTAITLPKYGAYQLRKRSERLAPMEPYPFQRTSNGDESAQVSG